MADGTAEELHDQAHAGGAPRWQGERPREPSGLGAAVHREPARNVMPYAGLHVLEIASYLAAPLACTHLSDLGARVTSIQRPEGARGARTEDRWRPETAEALDMDKTLVPLDLKTEQGQLRLADLIRSADVVVVGFSTAAMGRSARAHAAARPADRRLSQAPDPRASCFAATCAWLCTPTPHCPPQPTHPALPASTPLVFSPSYITPRQLLRRSRLTPRFPPHPEPPYPPHPAPAQRLPRTGWESSATSARTPRSHDFPTASTLLSPDPRPNSPPHPPLPSI